MRRFVWGSMFVCGALLLGSCAKEDELTADFERPYLWFAPDPAATDEEAVLRREFYEETGSYLLFTDTLRHEFLSLDWKGDSAFFTEKIAIDYTIGDSNSGRTSYTYEYLTDIETKRTAVQYLKDYVLVHVTRDIKPFSWFLANKITGSTGTDKLTNPYAVAGQRSMVVSCYLIPRLSESGLKQFTSQVLLVLIDKSVENRQDDFADFFSVSSAWYSGTFSAADNAENTEILRSHGFISRGLNMVGIEANGYYPTRTADLRDYARLLILYTPEQLDTNYGRYPLVMEKLDRARRTLEQLGFVF